MIFTKESAMAKARMLTLHSEDYEGHRRDIAAALLEAQAEALWETRESSIRVGDHLLGPRDSVIARLRREAAELREG